MRKIISGNELEKTMDKAINLLCDTVKVTLGPYGNNVVIDKDIMPFITNDGVTIAQSIETESDSVNAILNIAKEAATKTNEVVGDGTTTTLVLLQSLYNNGKKIIKEGKNPLVLKKELDESVEKVNKIIESISKLPKSSDYKKIASISANDEEIGKLVSDLFLKINQKGGIKVNESLTNYTYSEIINGYMLDDVIINEYFFNDCKEIDLKNVYVMIIKKEIYSIEQISQILNVCIKEKKEILIIADSYSKEFINDFIVLNIKQLLKGVLIEVGEYGSRKNDILKDISVFTGSKIVDFNYNKNIDFEDINIISEVKIDKNKALLINNNKNNKDIENRVSELKKELENSSEYDKEFINERISKLKNGFGIIYVGSATKTERREKKMRIEDSVNAIFSAVDGILPGEGIAFVKVCEKLKEKTDGDKILKLALESPFVQIMLNLGKNPDKMLNIIKEKNYFEIYNHVTDSFEDINKSNILDSTLVLKTALLNSVSIVTMLLTTKYIIINTNKTDNNNIVF